MANMTNTTNACPRCHFEPLRGHVEEAEAGALACPQCQGVWLSTAAAREVLPASLGPLANLPRPGDAGGPLRCPICGLGLTLRCVFGVGIDICEAHGVWFDHREVERIRAAARHESGARTIVDADSVDTRTGPGPRKTRIATRSDDAIDTSVVVAEAALVGVDVAVAAGHAGDVAEVGAEAAGGLFAALGGLFEGIFG